MSLHIERAAEEHLEALLPLFMGYRTFYEQKPDETGAREYLRARMANDEAVVFLASNKPGEYAGFVLLYPSFDSVEMARIWVLHDLFVAPEYRGTGAGRLLMETARKYCETQGAERLDLATARDNSIAQGLYESLGYERDADFYFYSLELDTKNNQ